MTTRRRALEHMWRQLPAGRYLRVCVNYVTSAQGEGVAEVEWCMTKLCVVLRAYLRQLGEAR